MGQLGCEQFQLLSRCEAIQMAKDVEEKINSTGDKAYDLGFRQGVDQVYKLVNERLKERGSGCMFTYKIEKAT